MRRTQRHHHERFSARRTIRAALALGRDESGFTLIEMIVTAVILAIVAAPIAGVLLASAAESAVARERTAADQLLEARLEAIRTLSYTQVGTVNGNPSGTLPATAAASLPNGEQVTVAIHVSYVSDPIPTVVYLTHADYKRVVVTITRNSDGSKLVDGTTLVASASAPPLAGTDWVQISRQTVDAVTTLPITSATVALTGGPPGSVSRSDVTDGSGTVLFPALDSSTTVPPPNYLVNATAVGYATFPDDVAPMAPGQVAASPGANSTATIRMYLPTSLTVNVQASNGTPYTAGATVSVESTRCGVTAVTIPAGQSSTTVTSCQTSSSSTIPLVPNVLGQSPAFDKYSATAWSASGGLWGATTPFTVPSAYPSSLTQTATLKFSATTYGTTKQVKVTVTKGGSADGNARVTVTGGPAGVYLYGTTAANGTVTLTVPVTSTATTYTVSANDQGAASGTTTFNASTGSTSPINAPVTIS